MWILIEAKALKLLIIIEAKNVSRVHCGWITTCKIMSDRFIWKFLGT